MSRSADPSPGAEDPRERFFALLAASLAEHTFTKLVLAKPRSAEPGLLRIDVRRIALRGEAHLSLVHHYAARDITKNLPNAAALAHLRLLVGGAFQNAHLFTHNAESQLRCGKRGTVTLSTAKVRGTASPAGEQHDRSKHRLVDPSRPFLVELGVTTREHTVVPSMARKWKQINRFTEVFAHAVSTSALAEAGRITVADFGAGKGYLTFAVHDWLRQRNVEADVTGIEVRPELVQAGNDVVARLGLSGLQFALGDVHGAGRGAQVVIALHACDVATDHALHLGVQSGAEILICSPCCHKEVRPQLQAPPPLEALLQHGVHRDLQAEMVTDALRALLLEASGYATQVFEFVSLEHTGKNKMILGVKRAEPGDTASLWAKVAALKQFYGIREQRLETLLRKAATH